MRKSLRGGLLVAVFALAAPLASNAQLQTGPDPAGWAGGTYFPGQGTSQLCGLSGGINVNGGCLIGGHKIGAPEIGASSSVGGIALLVCGVLMMRGRKREVAI
jgi:hypothetical protein